VNEPEELSEQDAGLLAEADLVKGEKDGFEYDPRSLVAQQWVESQFESPATLFDENVDHTYWHGLAAHMKRIIRRTSDPRLRECREVAWRLACIYRKNRVITTPFRTQFEIFDLLVASIPMTVNTREFMDAKGRIDETVRFWRESHYHYFQKRFLGRDVG
jgi:hypothetical protein